MMIVIGMKKGSKLLTENEKKNQWIKKIRLIFLFLQTN